MFRKYSSLIAIVFLLTVSNSFVVHADDWTRFRGPDGSGVVLDSEASRLPTQWSPDANLAWTTSLPGPGVSSPIIDNGMVFVTCYSGYGLDQANPGEIEKLTRHLVCVELESGEIRWQRDIPAAMPEDPFSGVGVPAHGYASHTPVSDGESVYVFFGKSGVFAFDFNGEQRWQAEVGRESDPTKWGSSSSPVLYNDTVIVTAASESQSIIGLDKTTGKELWRQEAAGLDGMWGTPTLVQVSEDRTDLVMCVAKEMWGLDPTNGKLRWYANATGAEHAYSSVITDSNKVFAFTGRGGGSIALKIDGSGDVSDSNTLWTGPDTASFGSPVRHESKIYVVSRGVVTIVDAETGEKTDQVRLQGAERSGGRFGSLDYASPVVVGDNLFYLNGSGQMFVLDLADNAKQIAVNKVTRQKESFGGSPAISGERMIIRSEKALYCVMNQGDTVLPEDQFDSSVADQASEPAERDGRGGFGGGDQSQGGRGEGGEGRFDPMSIFASRDANKDGRLTQDEIAGGPMADRMSDLDKDGDSAISQEEFRTGMSSMFGGNRGGGGPRGSNGPNGAGGNDNNQRPTRPQRPVMAG